MRLCGSSFLPDSAAGALSAPRDAKSLRSGAGCVRGGSGSMPRPDSCTFLGGTLSRKVSCGAERTRGVWRSMLPNPPRRAVSFTSMCTVGSRAGAPEDCGAGCTGGTAGCTGAGCTGAAGAVPVKEETGRLETSPSPVSGETSLR